MEKVDKEKLNQVIQDATKGSDYSRQEEERMKEVQ